MSHRPIPQRSSSTFSEADDLLIDVQELDRRTRGTNYTGAMRDTAMRLRAQGFRDETIESMLDIELRPEDRAKP